MAQHSAHENDHKHEREAHGSLKSYIIGFVLSLVLTAIPLTVVLSHWLEGGAAVAVLVGSAVLQFVVQLVYFMHLREEKKPRWNLLALLLGLVVLMTIVAGSMWIMLYNQVAH
jgi:cytochrome o ubiquinol oxidase subunit IV